jgi:hypothetical protein
VFAIVFWLRKRRFPVVYGSARGAVQRHLWCFSWVQRVQEATLARQWRLACFFGHRLVEKPWEFVPHKVLLVKLARRIGCRSRGSFSLGYSSARVGVLKMTI